MSGHPFDGLSTPAERALEGLERCVASLTRTVSAGSWAHQTPQVQDAAAALIYFVVQDDVIPDSRPGGLVDDLALMVAIVTRIDPAALASWEADREELRSKLPGPQASAALMDRLRRIAAVADRTRLLDQSRAKLDDVRRQVRDVAGTGASTRPQAPASGGSSPSGGRSSAEASGSADQAPGPLMGVPRPASGPPGPTQAQAREAMRMYMTLVAGALLAKKRPDGLKSRRAPRARGFEHHEPRTPEEIHAQIESLLQRMTQLGG